MLSTTFSPTFPILFPIFENGHTFLMSFLIFRFRSVKKSKNEKYYIYQTQTTFYYLYFLSSYVGTIHYINNQIHFWRFLALKYYQLLSLLCFLVNICLFQALCLLHLKSHFLHSKIWRFLALKYYHLLSFI